MTPKQIKQKIEELEDNYPKDSKIYKELKPKLEKELEEAKKIDNFESKKQAYLTGIKQGVDIGKKYGNKL